MSNHLSIYPHSAKNEKFLKKLLHRLEDIHHEKWIERKATMLSSVPWEGAPEKDVRNREVRVICADSSSTYPEPSSFVWSGTEIPIQGKMAFDYDRCVMYWCEGRFKRFLEDDLIVLLYDRHTGKWYACCDHQSTASSFLDWISHLL